MKNPRVELHATYIFIYIYFLYIYIYIYLYLLFQKVKLKHIIHLHIYFSPYLNPFHTETAENKQSRDLSPDSFIHPASYFLKSVCAFIFIPYNMFY